MTRHGIPAALMIGVEGSDWETLALQTNPSFWRMIEKRRMEPTVSLEAMRKLTKVASGRSRRSRTRLRP